jgi:hypothetical protein
MAQFQTLTPAQSAQRFWAKVDCSGDCWPWTGVLYNTGYGSVKRNGRPQLAHRFAWTLVNGPIPDGLLVCHHCDNPPCCNPAHLFLGTHKTNAADKVAKGRGINPVLVGERNPRARATEAIVREVRSLSAMGVSYSALARQFALTKECVAAIVQRRTWAHVH